MRKFYTIIILFGLLYLSYALINKGLNMFLSGPRLQAMLIEPIEEKLGRDVEIGFMKVTLLKGISIREAVVKDINPDKQLASIGSFNLSYDLFSLLQRRLVITSVEINNPRINIVRDKKGISNIETLGSPAPKKEPEPNYEVEPVDPIPLDLVFNNVTINNAALSFKDMTGELPNVEADADALLSILLGKSLAETEINGSVNVHANSEYKGKHPVLLFEGKFHRDSFTFQGNLSVEFDKFIFNGKAENYAASPAITLNINSPKLNLDNMLAILSGGEVPVKVGQNKTVPADNKPAVSHPVTVDEKENPALPSSADESTEIASAVQTLPTEKTPGAKPLSFSCLGKVTVTELVSKDFKASNISVLYNLEKETLQLKHITANIFGGNIGGNVNLNILRKKPPVKGSISSKNIQVAELLKTMGKPAKTLSGTLTTNLSFSGVGLDWPSLQTSLNGKGDYTLTEGGINSQITSTLASVLGIPELSNLQYKDISGSFAIVNGDVLLNASLKGSQFDMESTGTIGLNGSLKMPLSLRLSPEYSQKLGEKASFSKYLADEEGRVSLRLIMTGTASEPKIRVDEKQAVAKTKQVAVKKAGEELQKAINKKLGENSEEGNIVKELSDTFLQQMLK